MNSHINELFHLKLATKHGNSAEKGVEVFMMMFVGPV